MKASTRIKRLLITALILVGGFFLCQWIYVLFDRIMNGFVVDWFEEHYILELWVPTGENEGYYNRTIRWGKLKSLLLKAFIVFVMMWLLTVRLVSILYAARQERKALRAAGRMIGDYMHHDREASEVFPGEYAEVSVQMTQIKAAIQRHEQMLKDEAARKNDLITYLAHDLKTPLTSVIGYLSLLEEAPDLPAEQRAKYVHITLEKALNLEKLINEFFEITRYNLQQIVLEKESVDLPFMLVQLTDEFYPVLNARGNTIRLEIEPDGESAAWETGGGYAGEAGHTDAGGCAEEAGRQESGSLESVSYVESADAGIMVYADVEKLARVFQNILKNAIAYSYPNTEIWVGCRKCGDRVQVVFSNWGRTIPRQKLDSIFEKFFRLDDARNTNTGGAGLGLAIAREIVNLHGGAITADSADEVTTFTVELPLYGEAG